MAGCTINLQFMYALKHPPCTNPRNDLRCAGTKCRSESGSLNSLCALRHVSKQQLTGNGEVPGPSNFCPEGRLHDADNNSRDWF